MGRGRGWLHVRHARRITDALGCPDGARGLGAARSGRSTAGASCGERCRCETCGAHLRVRRDRDGTPAADPTMERDGLDEPRRRCPAIPGVEDAVGACGVGLHRRSARSGSRRCCGQRPSSLPPPGSPPRGCAWIHPSNSVGLVLGTEGGSIGQEEHPIPRTIRSISASACVARFRNRWTSSANGVRVAYCNVHTPHCECGLQVALLDIPSGTSELPRSSRRLRLGCAGRI